MLQCVFARFTVQLLVQVVNLGVRIVDDFIHLSTQVSVLVGERFGKVFLIDATDSQLLTASRVGSYCTFPA